MFLWDVFIRKEDDIIKDLVRKYIIEKLRFYN